MQIVRNFFGSKIKPLTKMGHVSIVYGNIIGATWRSEEYHKLQRLNKKVVDSLPENDDAFPWLTRRMFLVPDPEKDRIYRDQVIVFGASYKSVEHEWHEWLIKFESILKQLYWASAVIHLETELVGDHKYEWLSSNDQFGDFTTGNPCPTTTWSFTGGPRQFFDNYRRIDISDQSN